MENYQGVLICGETAEGKVAPITKELLNAGGRLSDQLGHPMSALLIGKDIHESAEEVITLGSDNVYIVDAPSFLGSHPDHYANIIAESCEVIRPFIILFGHNDMGRDVAPRLGAKLKTTVTMDCVQISIDPAAKHLLYTKPVYGGNAMAVWITDSDGPHIATLRARSVMPAEPDTHRRGKIIVLNITKDDSIIKGRLIETVEEVVKGVRLEEADIIVAGGGGIGGSDGFKLIEDLAGVLGGATGASRVPCIEGWMQSSKQIGQTAHIVGPKLYIAIGISGAPQHMAGCSDSKCIVAINRDDAAPIFKVSDFGVVGDYREALPALIEKCIELIN